MQMTDIQPAEAWRGLERELHARHGLNVHAYDAKGGLFTGESLWCNDLCPAIHARPQGVAAICSVANAALAAEAKKTGRPVIDACDAGLLKITVPVIVDGEMIGAVGGCGRVPEDGEADSFLVRMAAGLPEAEAEKLCAGVPTMTRAEAEAAAADMAERVAALVAAYAARRA